ncbi:MAG TPA: hypothetical protein VF173_10710 [Thermoanaerobaculia bacterium]|nr:hypothetical protein [Thermoanaerobaculia bacterium]
MALAVEPESFLRDFVTNFLESYLLNGLLSIDEYHDRLARIERDGSFATASRQLFENAPEAVHLDGYGNLRVIELREPNGSKFPFLQGLARRRLDRRRLTCFIGHRFLANIEQSLRYNLVHLLAPYDVVLRWSGYDLSARDIFDDVVSGIRTADLCVFDNLGTLNRPNVYIEIGIAHALGKPMLVCEYTGGASGGRKRIPDTGSVPSDLQGLFRIQYSSYQDLCRQLYFKIPIFLEHNKLH